MSLKFEPTSAPGEKVTLVSPYSKMCLDVKDDSPTNETVISSPTALAPTPSGGP